MRHRLTTIAGDGRSIPPLQVLNYDDLDNVSKLQLAQRSISSALMLNSHEHGFLVEHVYAPNDAANFILTREQQGDGEWRSAPLLFGEDTRAREFYPGGYASLTEIFPILGIGLVHKGFGAFVGAETVRDKYNVEGGVHHNGAVSKGDYGATLGLFYDRGKSGEIAGRNISKNLEEWRRATLRFGLVEGDHIFDPGAFDGVEIIRVMYSVIEYGERVSNLKVFGQTRRKNSIIKYTVSRSFSSGDASRWAIFELDEAGKAARCLVMSFFKFVSSAEEP